MTDNLKPYDPRPEWMQQYHKEVSGGADKFKEWAKASLNIDIDDQLQYDQGTSKAGIAAQVLEAVNKQYPFILHNGPKRFCTIIPKLQIIVIYAHSGNVIEALNVKQFQNRVRMLYVIYPKFEYASLNLVKAALDFVVANWKTDPTKQVENGE